MEKNKKCLHCGETHFLEIFTIPWWSEIVARDGKGAVLIKWKDQLVCRDIALCPKCAANLATLLREMEEQIGGKDKSGN